MNRFNINSTTLFSFIRFRFINSKLKKSNKKEKESNKKEKEKKMATSKEFQQLAKEFPTRPFLDPEKKMRALIYDGKKKISYVEKPKPLISHPKDILLKVTASTICGSDLHLFSGNMSGMEKGDILGHEFMGVVEEIGAEVKKIQVGERVVVSFDIACGQCNFCKREEYTACEVTNDNEDVKAFYGHKTSALFGYSHLTGGVQGGQAEFVRVPFADVNCLPIPDNVDDEHALYLSDVVPTSYHGTELGSVKEGSSVGIWGLGAVGLLTAKWCKIKKAGKIIGIDCIPERLQMAKKLGIEVINFKEQDTLKAIFEKSPTGLDVSIECAGFEYAKTWYHKLERSIGLETDTADILTECVKATRPFGSIAIIGVYSGYCNHFPIGAIMEKSLVIKCGQSPTQKYWEFCLEKIRSGEFDPTFIISHHAKLKDGPELYEKFYNREEGMIKVFLRP